MQPTFTHVPPSPHLVPRCDGRTKSNSATFWPSRAACVVAHSACECVHGAGSRPPYLTPASQAAGAAADDGQVVVEAAQGSVRKVRAHCRAAYPWFPAAARPCGSSPEASSCRPLRSKPKSPRGKPHARALACRHLRAPIHLRAATTAVLAECIRARQQ